MDRQSQDTWRQLWDHYLPPYLSRDPQAVAALQLSAPSESPGLIRIRDRILEIPETNVFDLTQYTLSQLAAALTDAGWTASLVPSLPSDLAAVALMDTGYSAFSPTAWQDTADLPWLTISGSVLWQYLRPVVPGRGRHAEQGTEPRVRHRIRWGDDRDAGAAGLPHRRGDRSNERATRGDVHP